MGQAADYSKESWSSNSHFLSSDNYKRSQSSKKQLSGTEWPQQGEGGDAGC